jgi:hypothetical protein
LGSLADVFARGVDGGAVLVESVRDYHGQDYFTLITYGRGGKEFGSLHRNDEVISCGLMRDVPTPFPSDSGHPIKLTDI